MTDVDRSAPGVRITALPNERASEGFPVSLDGRIVSFAYEDSERGSDLVTLRLDNFDLSLFDREELQGGAILEVSWGYPTNMAPPRRVVIKKIRGFTTLTVEGHALSALMNREVKTRRWETRSRSDVVKEIAAEHGYAGEFLQVQDTAEVFDVIGQAAETDARFLRRLALREAYEFHVDHTGLHWHERRQEGASVKVLTWYYDADRGEVLSLSIESDLARRTGRVTVKGRDPLAKSTIESSATNTNVDRVTLGQVVEVVDPETGQTALERRNATASVRPTPATNLQRASMESAARFRRSERSAVKLSMAIVGDPTLSAKSVIDLRGVPSRFGGKYYVQEARHEISGSGYLCTLKLTRGGKGRTLTKIETDQGGEKNTSEPVNADELMPIEVVDPQTGETHIEYR